MITKDPYEKIKKEIMNFPSLCAQVFASDPARTVVDHAFRLGLVLC